MSDALNLPALVVRNGVPMTTSVDVARVFGKPHKNVLRDIDRLADSDGDGFCALNFEPTSIDVQQPRGGARQVRAVEMTRDGFTLLAMGFTGEPALRFKKAYIRAFNALEAELRERQPPTMPAAPRADVDDRKLLDTCLKEAGKGNVPALETLVRRFGYPAEIVERQLQVLELLRGRRRRKTRAELEREYIARHVGPALAPEDCLPPGAVYDAPFHED